MLKLSVRVEILHEQTTPGMGKFLTRKISGKNIFDKSIFNSELLNKTTQTVFTNVNSVNISTSIENMTDLCTIKLPRKASFDGNDVTDYMKPGDKIAVQLGYNEDLKTIFRGYITKISTTIPLTIDCENEGYNLKKINVSPETHPDFNIEKFCKENITGCSLDVTSRNLGKVVFDHEMTLPKALSLLKEKYGFYFFVREEEKESVFYGISEYFKLPSDKQVTLKFEFGRNIIHSSLRLVSSKHKDIQVITRNVSQLTNQYLEGESPLLEGKFPLLDNKQYQKIHYTIDSATNNIILNKEAEIRYDNMVRDTMEGTITTFGTPFARKGDIAHLIDGNTSEHNDRKFLITGVNYNFGQAGYRQILTLGGAI